MPTKILIGLLLFLAALGGYSNSLHNPFVLDDHITFNDNTMTDLKFIPYHFLPGKGSVFGMPKNNNKGYYRPMTSSTYTLLNVFFQKDPVFYHLSNIVFLWAAGFLIYLILYSYFPQSGIAAFLSGLFFILHPLNSTLINYIGLGAYMCQVAFMLLSLWFLAGQRPAWAAFSFLVACFFHESAMALPLYATVLVLALKRPASAVWPLWLVFGAYFLFSVSRTSVLNNLLQNSPVTSTHLGLGDYLPAYGKMGFWYLSHLLFPTNIVFMAGAPLAPGVLWTVFLFVLILAAAAVLIWLWKRQENVLFLGMGWMAMAIVPGLLGGIGRPNMICVEPHWVIFALIGFCVCLGQIIKIKNHVFGWLMAFLICFCWFCLDRQYNVLWSNEKVYCYYWHSQIPFSQVPYYYLANVYQNEGDFEEAKEMFIETFRSPHFTESFDYNVNIGIIEVQQGQWDQAKMHLQNALSMQPDNTLVLTHLGIIAMMQKDNALAHHYLDKAIENKLDALSRLDLAVLYGQERNIQGAMRMYKEILAVNPTNEIALVELIKIYIQQGDRDNILKIADILSKHSHNPNVLRNVDLIFQHYGHTITAKENE